MNTMTEMFQETLKNGIKALETGEMERSKIYAEFAKAIAMTGTVCIASEITEDSKSTVNDIQNKKDVQDKPKTKEVKEKKQENTKTAKLKTQKSEVTNIEPKIKEKAEKENKTTKKTQEKLNSYIEAFGTDAVLECLSMFSNGVLKSMDDITEENVEAFIEYLEVLIEGIA